jgi:hypothetical protein
MAIDLVGKFSGFTTFIQKMVSDFYFEISQNLRAWIPAAPEISLKHGEQGQN